MVASETPPFAHPPGPSSRSIVPIHGTDLRVPSPLLVRSAVGVLVGQDPAQVRAAEAVAAAVGEQVRSRLRSPKGVRWDVPIPIRFGELQAITGLTDSEVGAAVELLEAANALDRNPSDQVRLVPDYLAEIPCLARIEWEKVRRRLSEGDARIAPAVAVLREIGREANEMEGQGSAWVDTSVDRVVRSTGYGRTAVSTSLSALGSTGLLDRARQRSLRIRIAAGAFERTEAGPGPSDTSSPAVPPDDNIPVQFGGIDVRVPRGVTIELSVDADGRERLRIGRNLELGPL